MKSERIFLEIDPGRCVLCGEPNDCARAAGAIAEEEQPGAVPAASDCWCFGEAFPDALRRKAEAVGGRARCICRSCLAANA